MKKSHIILASVLGVLIVLLGSIPFAINYFGKNYTEDLLEEKLGVEVEIESFGANILNKSARLENLRIVNPAGFSSANAIEVQEVFFRIGKNSGAISIDELSIEGLRILVEQNKSGINLYNLFRKIGEHQKKEAADPLIKISNFKNNNTTIAFRTNLFDTQIKLPNLSLNNLGGESGSPASKVIETFMKDNILTKQTGEQFAQAALMGLANKIDGQGSKFIGDAIAQLATQVGTILSENGATTIGNIITTSGPAASEVVSGIINSFIEQNGGSAEAFAKNALKQGNSIIEQIVESVMLGGLAGGENLVIQGNHNASNTAQEEWNEPSGDNSSILNTNTFNGSAQDGVKNNLNFKLQNQLEGNAVWLKEHNTRRSN